MHIILLYLKDIYKKIMNSNKNKFNILYLNKYQIMLVINPTLLKKTQSNMTSNRVIIMSNNIVSNQEDLINRIKQLEKDKIDNEQYFLAKIKELNELVIIKSNEIQSLKSKLKEYETENTAVAGFFIFALF